MKASENQETTITGWSALSTESQLCFGAAGGCLVLGLIGYGMNALTSTETPLNAFFVISVFYAMLGAISLFKSKPPYAMQVSNLLPSERPDQFQRDAYADEAAA